MCTINVNPDALYLRLAGINFVIIYFGVKTYKSPNTKFPHTTTHRPTPDSPLPEATTTAIYQPTIQSLHRQVISYISMLVSQNLSAMYKNHST